MGTPTRWPCVRPFSLRAIRTPGSSRSAAWARCTVPPTPSSDAPSRSSCSSERYASDETVRERFAREGLAAARLSSEPGIVMIFDVGENDGRPFIVMEFLSGGSLQEVLEREGAQPPPRVLRWLEDAAEGLDRAHARGVVHRDVKPGNLLLDADGRRSRRRLRRRERRGACLAHRHGHGHRHRRLPLARAGAGLGGNAGERPLLACRRRVGAAGRECGRFRTRTPPPRRPHTCGAPFPRCPGPRRTSTPCSPGRSRRTLRRGSGAAASSPPPSTPRSSRPRRRHAPSPRRRRPSLGGAGACCCRS